LLDPLPSVLNPDDSATASDHLPVLMAFKNPFTVPFGLTSIRWSNQNFSLTWESMPGQSYQVAMPPDFTNWFPFATRHPPRITS